MRRLLLGVLALALAACGNGDQTADSATGGRLEITGSSTLAPLIAEIGARFEAAHPDARIAVQTGGSSRGISDAAEGLADIGMSSRELTETEQRRLRQHRIGVDGIAVILHRDNPVDRLSREQLVALFTGGVDNWQEVGGADRAVTVVDKADGRATLTEFLRFFDLPREAIAAHLIIGDNQHGIRSVAGNPGAIGYVSVGAGTVEAERGTAIRLVAIDEQWPTLETVRNGDYALTRDLILVSGAEPSALTLAFIDFVRDAAVHDLYADFGYVPAAE